MKFSIDIPNMLYKTVGSGSGSGKKKHKRKNANQTLDQTQIDNKNEETGGNEIEFVPLKFSLVELIRLKFNRFCRCFGSWNKSMDERLELYDKGFKTFRKNFDVTHITNALRQIKTL